MQSTTNYDLTKPESTDFYDVNVQNENMDIIDEKLKDIEKNISNTDVSITEHIADKDNPHEVTKEQVGLGNVDNTSDMDKPVSTEQQKAINQRMRISHALVPAGKVCNMFRIDDRKQKILGLIRLVPAGPTGPLEAYMYSGSNSSVPTADSVNNSWIDFKSVNSNGNINYQISAKNSGVGVYVMVFSTCDVAFETVGDYTA